jgi:hypothetical protein
LSDRSFALTRTLSCVFLLGCVALYVIRTWHWPLMGDAALMHYIVFLMDHGMAPYRDIIDPNMPTTLLIQGAVVHSFGGSSLAWRLFDFGLLGVSGAAMIAICRPYGWFAGVFAAVLYAMIHGRDGFIQLGQRDLIMTAFLVMGFAFLFEGMRAASAEKIRPWMTALFGVCCGIAGTIKPPLLLLAPAILLMQAVVLKRRGRPFLASILCGVGGVLAPGIAVFAYLVHRHVVHAFFETLFNLIPYFALLFRRSLGHLVLHSISGVMLPVVLLWSPIVFLERKRWLTWERAALLVGAAFGLVSFYMQGKGYPYHRYPSEAFLLLLAGIDFVTVLKKKPWNRDLGLHRLALAGVVVGVVVVAGGSMVHALRQDWQNQEFDTLLRADLNRLGGERLEGQVQCLDMADGCITALYNMQLVQASGFLYDCYMLSSQTGAERERYREAFWEEMMRVRPRIFVVSSKNCELWPAKESYDYAKLGRWPRFDDYLKENYRLEVDRIPPHMVNSGSGPSKPLGYRLYVRDDAGLKPVAAQ